MLQENNNKDQIKDEGKTGVIPQHLIRKAPTGCRGFLLFGHLLFLIAYGYAEGIYILKQRHAETLLC